MKPLINLVGLVVSVVCGLLLGLTAGVGHADPRAPESWQPPPKTIVAVEGDKANGFAIHHYDGSATFPPTDSEAAAECSAYDPRVKRVRCKVQVRTWYRDLGRLKRALRFAHSAGGDD